MFLLGHKATDLFCLHFVKQCPSNCVTDDAIAQYNFSISNHLLCNLWGKSHLQYDIYV